MDYQRERESIRAGQLILKELNGELSVSERAELKRWLGKSPVNRRTYANLQSGELRSEELEGLRNYDSTESLRNLLPRLSPKPKSRSYKIYVGLAAALLISIIVAIGFYLRNQHTNQEMQLSSKYGGAGQLRRERHHRHCLPEYRQEVHPDREGRNLRRHRSAADHRSS